MERAYTVSELNALRKAVEMRWLYGTAQDLGMRASRVYTEEEKMKSVEELVRTHMLAGHVAEDIYRSDMAI